MSKSIEEVSVGVMGTSLHSYHGNREQVCSDEYTAPSGFKGRHLNINEHDVTAMIVAYKSDRKPFHKVDLRHVYAVAVGDDTDILPITKVQTQPWIGTQIFPIAPPGCTHPILYTPASAAMKRWGDPTVLAADEKMDRVLAPLIPNNAQVKLTVLGKIATEGTTTTRDELHMTLKHELRMLCHAMQSPRPSRTDTMKALRAMTYCPSAEIDAQYFCDTCAVCLANRSPMLNLGSTMTSTRRVGVMMIDKLVFDDDVALLVGIPAALLMACPQISDAQISLCYSATAVGAARVLFVTGAPQFSIPMTTVSDSEPAFAAQVTQELAKMFGVTTCDFGPVSSPRHAEKMKRRMKPYNRAKKGAMTAGAITRRRTMEVVLAAALITQT